MEHMGGQNLVQSSLVGVRLEREPLGGRSGLNVPLPFSEVFSFSISLIHSWAWPSFPSFPSEKVRTRPFFFEALLTSSLSSLAPASRSPHPQPAWPP